jgi:two-component system response regulator (stage 0 sporulation protein F)
MVARELSAKALPRVVIADDDGDIRRSLAEILEVEGYEVIEARDGREALELCEAHCVALVLLDHRMPELTGAQVVEELRVRCIPTRIVLMTADHHVEEIARGAGIAHYLAKPFSVDSLLELIARALH